jgi:hypothetical protein
MLAGPPNSGNCRAAHSPHVFLDRLVRASEWAREHFDTYLTPDKLMFCPFHSTVRYIKPNGT